MDDEGPDDGAVDDGIVAEAEDVLSRLFRSSRANAVLSRLLVAVLAAVFAESLLGAE